MAKTTPRKTNRHKQNGKGSTVLAVLLVFIIMMMVGIYYFLQWNHEQDVVQKKAPVSDQKKTEQPAVQLRASSVKPAEEQLVAVPKQPGAEWEHYTDDATLEKPAAKDAVARRSKPELAIIIDDMGSSVAEAEMLARIGVPLTFAIIPGLRHDREVAATANTNQNIEVMIHIPMQSKEYPQRRLESNGLLLSHDDGEIRSRMDDYFTRLPQAKGANNHTGSAFTEDTEKMRLVLSQLRERSLFFVDSVTTKDTVGARVAASLKLRTARRDVFLDNNQDEAYIRGQLAQAVARAKKGGRAIAICHPHPVTIKTLVAVLPELQKREGVTLVTASRLVK